MTDDPPVKIAATLSEPEAGMWRELLENNGIPAFASNMSGLQATSFGAGLANDFALFVKRSDLERAQEILKPLLLPEQIVEDDAG